jgi:acyl-CoA dehydrogenase-like protein
MWPEQGQIELFGDGDFRCPLSNLPAAAVRVDGGYRIDGWWDCGSGCDTATHFIGGIAGAGAPGGPPTTPAGRRSRARPTRSSTTGRELTMFQRDLGQATALVDTAEAALMQLAATWTAQAHDVAQRGVEVGDEAQRRLLMICRQVVELCAQAVDVIFRTAGTTATRKGEPVERCFRDINMIRTHVTMQFDRTFENVGQMRLGLPPAGFF